MHDCLLKVSLFLVGCFTISGQCALQDHYKAAANKTENHSIAGIDYLYVINLDHRTEKYTQTVEQFAPYHIVPYRFSAVNGWKLPLETLWDITFVFEKGMRGGGMATVYRCGPDGREYQSNEIVEEVGERYVCHCMSRGGFGCCMSHLSVLHDALISGYERVWICEDDVEIVRDPHILSRYIKELDTLVGRGKWDVLYTFRDYRTPEGHYDAPSGATYRPNVDRRSQARNRVQRKISPALKRVGARFGTQSMIWSREGMKKMLAYYERYKIFNPFDLDLPSVPGLKQYAVTEDVVTNALHALSDLGASPCQ